MSYDPYRGNELVRAAAEGRHLDVQWLRGQHDWSACEKALWWTDGGNHIDCVKPLLGCVDLKTNGSEALRAAARNGHTDIVKLLLPFGDPKANDSAALAEAAQNGHAECVQLLIAVSDLEVCANAALQEAVVKNHLQCVELLLPYCDVDLVLNNIPAVHTGAGISLLQQYVNAKHQHSVLNGAVDACVAVSGVKRKL